ncbi:hypothetical protein [Flavicella sp.]|uniref:hypothetical protein n=1 Tax=Flavicella sp. TaxID=2957742 RepID=UPI002639FD4E|nr:hypothetical protein [Flavicella sp.]MDG1805481.1 hypothetical protein [Flavicella sp.]
MDTMKKYGFLAVLSLLLACDDGDFNVPSFDFDGLTINSCGNTILNKITSSGTESLILQLNIDNTDDVFFKTPLDSVLVRIEPGTNNTMFYKIFNDAITSSYFCVEIPPSTPIVTEEWFGEGDLYITNTITLDDNDGVPLEVEQVIDPNTGTWLDTDGDGYPDFIDIDDDGDNKLTINEDIQIANLPPTSTGDPQTVDTDGDGIPNYLDTDDDNDGIPSIEESETADTNVNTIVDYLDKDDMNPITPASPVTNTYAYKYVMRFEFSELTLYNESSTINYQDGYNYGTKSGEFTSTENPGDVVE